MEFVALVVWWVALVGLGAVGLPLAAVLLGALPDRGAALALPVSLLLLFVPVYWVGQLRYGPSVVAAAALLVAGLSVLAARRSPPIAAGRFAEWVVVFTLAFLFLVAIRSVDPGIVPGGGEKFLDYGLVQTLLRATSLPPEDFWFAGEPVAYYYGGHLLVASLVRLTATPAPLAFNLALAGFYGALVGGSYGVAGSIAEARGGSYRWAGGLAAFFVGLASNVVPLLQAVLWALPRGTASRVAAVVADRTALPAEQLYLPEQLSYWTASRVLPGTINEFPFFGVLNGDLHAHLMDTPFLLLVVGIGLAYALTPATAVRRRRLLVFGAVPPVAGTIAVVNTWGLPSAVGVTGLAVLFAGAPVRDLLPRRLVDRLPPPEGAPGEIARMGTALLAALGVGSLAVLWVLPFFLGPAATSSGRSIGLLPERSGLLAFLLVHGWFLLVYGLYLLYRAGPLVERRGVPNAAVLAVGWLLLIGLGVTLGAPALGIVLPMLAVAWYLLRRSERVGYEAVLFVAGAGLVVLVELLFVQEEAGPGRLNTVFKTYFQVWLLWGVGAGATVAALVPRPVGPSRRDLVATGLVLLLVVTTSIYGVVTLNAHFQDAPEPTLDGTAWASTYHPHEWEAIDGFVAELEGQPTIVSAPGCWCNPDEVATPYRWANAPSTFTGVPTVVGWQHEIGYRGRDAYSARYDDVETIYTGPAEERARLLAAYDVSYVYVGPNERAIYDGVDLSGAPELTIVFENERVTIYRVDRSQL